MYLKLYKVTGSYFEMVVSRNKEKILSFFGKGGVDESKIKELSVLWKVS